MANEIYNKLANALNSSFIEEDSVPDTLNKHLPTKIVEETKEEVEETLPAPKEEANLPETTKSTVFEEQQYVKDKLHETIDLFSEAMTSLNSDLRQGTPATKYEALSSMGKTLISALNELRSYDTIVKHEEQYESGGKTPADDQQTNVTINMNGADMLDKILEYKEKNITKSTEVEIVDDINEEEE
jgi:uncharacterized protein with HEPN domain